MKILIQTAFALLFGLSASAQFERFAPVVSVQNPALRAEQLPAPDFSAIGQRTLAIDETLPARLQHVLDSLYAKTTLNGKHGVAAAIIVPGQPIWTGAVGESHPGVPLTSQHLFEIASNTKTFTTAFIMQLAEEGKLSLSDPLSKWVPSYQNIDSTITIRQLLDHSSGIYDYLNDDPLAEILIRSYFYEPEKYWTPDEILSSYIGEPNFKQGTSYRYSNTNFLLLGVIAEKAAGADFASEVRRRFFTPLGLTSTFVGWKDSIVGEFTHNWHDTLKNAPMMNLGEIDKTAQLSMADAAGGNVSIPSDLALWVKALYEGNLLADSSKAQMIKLKTWPGGMRYGLGTVRVPYGTRSFYGHTGGLLGFYSNMFNNPKDSVTFVLYMNSGYFEGDVSINDYVLALLNEVYKPAASVADGSSQTNVSVSPNPISRSATITYALPATDHVRLSIYDLFGQELVVLANGIIGAGQHAVTLDAANFPAGAYTYRLSTSDGVTTGKVIVTR